MKNEPLMFIQTAKTDIKSSVHQVIYDSNKGVTDVDPKILKKAENLVIMYKKGKPVLCSVNYEGISLVGFPKDIVNSTLEVEVEEVIKTVKLEVISSITILKI
ncbi:hypothetical protein KHQ82_06870 [Mycoplasmatota bacterium]|nr:hypothetical protein KHQ82_06870 [Mycoplasmatota bacterium]